MRQLKPYSAPWDIEAQGHAHRGQETTKQNAARLTRDGTASAALGAQPLHPTAPKRAASFRSKTHAMPENFARRPPLTSAIRWILHRTFVRLGLDTRMFPVVFHNGQRASERVLELHEQVASLLAELLVLLAF